MLSNSGYNGICTNHYFLRSVIDNTGSGLLVIVLPEFMSRKMPICTKLLIEEDNADIVLCTLITSLHDAEVVMVSSICILFHYT